jgi:hypothetical protein
MDQKPVVFGKNELSEAEEAEMRRKIAEAKAKGGVNALKGSTPVGGVERPQIPDFRALEEQRRMASGSPVQESGISAATAAQLEQAAKALDTKAASTDVVEKVKKEEEDEGDDVLDLLRGPKDESRRILDNKTRRKEIEERCEPMKFEDLLLKDEVQQTVPIIPGKFEPRFRSITPEESLFIKKYLSKDNNSDVYMLEKYTLCQLALGIVAINGRPLPEHRAADGSVDQAAFEAKLALLRKKSGHIMDDLSLNYYWFDMRVRKLLSPDALGNG